MCCPPLSGNCRLASNDMLYRKNQLSLASMTSANSVALNTTASPDSPGLTATSTLSAVKPGTQRSYHSARGTARAFSSGSVLQLCADASSDHSGKQSSPSLLIMAKDSPSLSTQSASLSAISSIKLS